MNQREKDVHDIREVFVALVDAWNRGDAAAYGDCFTEDADYVTFMGQHLKGRAQIAEVHGWLFHGPLKGSKLESSALAECKPRFLAENVAVVHATGEARLANPEQDPNDRDSINTNVVVKQRGVWKITAFHNCRIQELPTGRR